MYCKNCGTIIDDSATHCSNCGTRFDNNKVSGDHSSFGFAILGFLIPLVGLIAFLMYEGKNPKKAKSAAKGALIGVITNVVLSIILVILYVFFAFSFFGNIVESFSSDIRAMDDVFREETTAEILEKYVDVSFGEFKVTDDRYLSRTSLDITVKNKAEKQYSYYITIEAVDANGVRLETDMIYADRLGAGQAIYLTAFEFVSQEKLNQFQNATFRVLEIDKYDH